MNNSSTAMVFLHDIAVCIPYCTVLIVGGAVVGGLLYYAISAAKGCLHPAPAITLVDTYVKFALVASGIVVISKLCGNYKFISAAVWVSLFGCPIVLLLLLTALGQEIRIFRQQQKEQAGLQAKREEMLAYVDWWP